MRFNTAFVFLEEYIFFPEVQRGLQNRKSAGVFLIVFDDLTRFWNPVPSAAGREQGAVLLPVFIFLSWFPHSGPQNKWNSGKGGSGRALGRILRPL